MSDRIVVEIPKNTREVIRVILGEFNSRPIAGARVWFKTDDGAWRPGKAGINFKVDHLPAVAEAFAQAVDQARAEGLIE